MSPSASVAERAGSGSAGPGTGGQPREQASRRGRGGGHGNGLPKLRIPERIERGQRLRNTERPGGAERLASGIGEKRPRGFPDRGGRGGQCAASDLGLDRFRHRDDGLDERDRHPFFDREQLVHGRVEPVPHRRGVETVLGRRRQPAKGVLHRQRPAHDVEAALVCPRAFGVRAAVAGSVGVEEVVPDPFVPRHQLETASRRVPPAIDEFLVGHGMAREARRGQRVEVTRPPHAGGRAVRNPLLPVDGGLEPGRLLEVGLGNAVVAVNRDPLPGGAVAGLAAHPASGAESVAARNRRVVTTETGRGHAAGGAAHEAQVQVAGDLPGAFAAVQGVEAGGVAGRAPDVELR